MSSNTTKDCASDDKLCIAREHDLAVIIIPSILLILFVIFLLCFIVLRFCTKSSKSNVIHSYGKHKKTQLKPDPPNNNHQDNRHPNQNHGNHNPNNHHDNHHPNNHHTNNHHGNYQPNNLLGNHHPNNHHSNQHSDNSQTNHHRQPQDRRSFPHRKYRHRSQLQGIDAPVGINPLEHEQVPMTVQHSPLNAKPPVAAVPQAAPEKQHRAFSQISALPQTLFLRPDTSVSLYRGQMEHRDVVLRVLKDPSPAAEKQRFLGFASFVSRLGPHPFIPALLGVISVTPPLMMVTEELQHRDLLGFLWRCRQNNSECDITEKRIYTMGQQVASALDYLHSQQCVHGNIAARSVLVGRDLTVKLWGLGSAFRRGQRGPEAGLGGAEGMELRKWQAPEVLARNGVTKNSDVWSFGILLYEMVTLGDAPFPELRDTELLQFLQRGKFMKKPASCSNTLYTLIKSCCQWGPQQRVSVPELSRRLEAGERTASSGVPLRIPERLDPNMYPAASGIYGL